MNFDLKIHEYFLKYHNIDIDKNIDFEIIHDIKFHN